MIKPVLRLFLTVCTAVSFVIATLAGIVSNSYAQFDEESTLTLNAKLTRDRANTFDESIVYYDVKNFNMKVSNETEICPTSDCTFKFIHEDTDGFTLDGVTDRTLEGVLKITSQGKTKIYNVSGDLSILEEENDPNGVVTREILEGTLQLYQGDDTFGGEEYEVNGTLTWNNEKNADLSLDGIL